MMNLAFDSGNRSLILSGVICLTHAMDSNRASLLGGHGVAQGKHHVSYNVHRYNFWVSLGNYSLGLK